MSVPSALDSSVVENMASLGPQKESPGSADGEKKKRQEPVLPQTTGTQLVQNIIYQCDHCMKSPLSGVRYRCKTCPEFDLCQECMSQGKHDPSHTLTTHLIEPVSRVIPRIGSNQAMVISSTNASMPFVGQQVQTDATVSSRPPRRSASGRSGGSFENSIERMDDVLAKTHVGPLPASSTSSNIASQFLELYDSGLAAMERYKKARVLEQINARIAMALVAIPQRIRRGANFVARALPEPVEQDMVTAALAGFVAQLITLDSEKLLGHIEAKSDDPVTEMLDLDKLRSNIETGAYFRRVEQPAHALQVFAKHMLKVFSRAPAYGVSEQYCNRIDKLARQAFDELRDAFGLDPQFSYTADGKDDSEWASEVLNGAKKQKLTINGTGASGAEKTATNSMKEPKGSASSFSSVTPPIPNASLQSAQASKKEKSKRRREEDDEVQEIRSTTTTGMTPGALAAAGSTRFVAPVRTTAATDPADFGDLRLEVKRLREDLDDAHARIDVLIHLLREKVANPLVRGLDRAGR